MKTKTLHIVRHGKALQEADLIQDDDRPLIVKGITNNILVAKKFIAKYPTPCLIVSSYAARALHTAHIFARVIGYQHEKIEANEELYLHGDKEIYNILEHLSDRIDSVMIVGHNPDVTYVANRFGAYISEISTSGVVSINFETNSWRGIEMAKKSCSSLSK